jgi:Secretion system C-terminal sorting domain
MKAIFTLFFILSFSVLFAQSLSLNVTELSILSSEGVSPGDVVLTNTSSVEVLINLTLERTCFYEGDATKLQIYFATACLLPTNDSIKTWPNIVVLAAGGSEEFLKINLDPPGSYASEWDIHFVNSVDSTDFVTLHLTVGEGELPECMSTSTDDFSYSISKAFPNPATDVIYVNYQIDVNDAPQLNMYNSMGVLLKSIPLNPQTASVSVDVADVAPGVYFYNITDGKDQSKMMSFIK